MAEERVRGRVKTILPAKLREERVPGSTPNAVWSMDFMLDRLFDGRRARILTIVDAYTQVSPAIDVRHSYRGADVVETHEWATKVYRTPKTIRVDNGPEFVSEELELWAYMNGVELDFSRPARPTDNAFIESFNVSFRTECLDARSKCEAWRRDYNDVRPHSSVGNKTPMELTRPSGQACPPRGN